MVTLSSLSKKAIELKKIEKELADEIMETIRMYGALEIESICKICRKKIMVSLFVFI